MGCAAGYIHLIVITNCFHPLLNSFSESGLTWTLTTLTQETNQPLPTEVKIKFSFGFINFIFLAAVISFIEGEDFLKIPSGARNGIKNGLELLLDVEAFEYGSFFHICRTLVYLALQVCILPQ